MSAPSQGGPDPRLKILGGARASTANATQVEHATWAVRLAGRGEFGGSHSDLKEYRAIVEAAAIQRDASAPEEPSDAQGPDWLGRPPDCMVHGTLTSFYPDCPCAHCRAESERVWNKHLGPEPTDEDVPAPKSALEPPLAPYETEDPTLQGTRQARWRDVDGVGLHVVVGRDGSVLLKIGVSGVWTRFETGAVAEIREFLALGERGPAAFPPGDEDDNPCPT